LDCHARKTVFSLRHEIRAIRGHADDGAEAMLGVASAPSKDRNRLFNEGARSFAVI
jgi:hypothetical protein